MEVGQLVNCLRICFVSLFHLLFWILTFSYFPDSFHCSSSFVYSYREAFKIFDPDKDGFISTKELKGVTKMLGTMLTKEEVEEFMAEADLVR